MYRGRNIFFRDTQKRERVSQKHFWFITVSSWCDRKFVFILEKSPKREKKYK